MTTKSEPHRIATDKKVANEYKSANITNIRRGKKEQNRQHITYARIMSKNGEMMVNATLDYCVAVMKKYSAIWD